MRSALKSLTPPAWSQRNGLELGLGLDLWLQLQFGFWLAFGDGVGIGNGIGLGEAGARGELSRLGLDWGLGYGPGLRQTSRILRGRGTALHCTYFTVFDGLQQRRVWIFIRITIQNNVVLWDVRLHFLVHRPPVKRLPVQNEPGSDSSQQDYACPW